MGTLVLKGIPLILIEVEDGDLFIANFDTTPPICDELLTLGNFEPLFHQSGPLSCESLMVESGWSVTIHSPRSSLYALLNLDTKYI